MKRIFFKLCLGLLLLMMSGASDVMAQEVNRHLVRPGETLYSIARQYGVSVKKLKDANPKVKRRVPSGTLLVIPTDTEQPKEGDEVQTMPQVAEEVPQVVADIIVPEILPAEDGVSTIAVILPFNLSAKSMEENKMQMRSVEFYQGMMIAVEEMQRRGQKIAIQSYDLGTQTLSDILAQPELLRADLIVAPMEVNKVDSVADFGLAHNIKVVSPFAFSQDMAAAYPNLFQLNTSKSMLYPELSVELQNRFKDYAIVFLQDSTVMDRPQEGFVPFFKQELSRQNVKYYDFAYGDPELIVKADSILGITENNALYIPTTTHREVLRRLFPCLMYLATNDTLQTPRQTAVLGYPEWVIYTEEFVNFYYDLNVYMFSKIYVNPFEVPVRLFYNEFKYWYGKDLMQLYPKYGMLGYDVAKYFLSAIDMYGAHFEQHIEGDVIETLQSVMNFHKNEHGSFINRGLYLVHFTPDTNIEKYVIQ